MPANFPEHCWNGQSRADFSFRGRFGHAVNAVSVSRNQFVVIGNNRQAVGRRDEKFSAQNHVAVAVAVIGRTEVGCVVAVHMGILISGLLENGFVNRKRGRREHTPLLLLDDWKNIYGQAPFGEVAINRRGRLGALLIHAKNVTPEVIEMRSRILESTTD